MNIAVVGCGALGSYYGAKLIQAGARVSFLLRSDYPAVRENGLFVHTSAGVIHVRPNPAAQPEQIGPVDLVIVALKTTANHAFPQLIPPLLGPDTLILTLQNGLGNEEQLAGLFGAARILGGLCFVCLNRVAPGVIHHLGFGKITLGEYSRPPLPRTERIAQIFHDAGVPCDLTANLEAAHWEKLVWNIPFNGLGVATAAGLSATRSGAAPVPRPLRACWPTDQLLAHPAWLGLVRDLMNEVMLAARHLGFPLDPDLPEKNLTRTRAMGAYKASTVIDFEQGKPIELESLFAEPLRRARAAGLAAPRLTALVSLLRHLQ